ncbi:amino acid permease [Halorientalis brevis]|uniref:Amino acid permease n=1 Tax=Halorientalis brevis TaxID=1126241 RepID=A0ABD6CAS6_9EURY|nr:universal stress protein [Halorientalis brevis]
MPKELERDLGLASVFAISVGAMVGSGIFILPALALKLAGPAVVLAYFLAALIVLPAALSKAEMATAMPEAGGTYVYIERSMGPLLGTIAGVGTWFSLTFKGALALVGGAPYIVLLLDLPVLPVAVGLASALVAINLFGAKQTGRMQVAIVAIMLAAMGWFLAGSVGTVESAGFDGFYANGTGGLLAAAGFVFVSYAGVTKVASVAEEIENPSRNIPLGMLGSLAFTTLLYVLVVFVLVGVTPSLDLAGSATPIADVAQLTLAEPGVIAVVVAAVLALVSTANAGILSSSRYPFAMSRDELAPPRLAHVSDRFDTPTVAITLTGIVTILLIVGVPIMEIAKLGSAFQILVFILVNVALVAFRESGVDGYDPDFTDPLYPWTQAFGIVGGVVLLTQMGWLPVVGAVFIIGGSTLWYLGYVRPRVRREGVARDALRRRIGKRAVERTRSTFEASPEYDVLVAVTEETCRKQEAALTGLATDVAAQRDGSVTVVRFDEVPQQLPLASVTDMQSPSDEAFENRMESVAAATSVPVEYGEIVSHDPRHAVVNFADHHDADLLVVGEASRGLWSRLFGSDTDWMLQHTPCDVLLVDADDVTADGEVALVTDEGPFEPVKVELADALASATGASLALIQGIPADATDEQRTAVRTYHEKLCELCDGPVDSRVVESQSPADLASCADSADLVVVQTSGSPTTARRRERLLDAVESPTVIVRPKRENQSGLIGRLFERVAF